MERIASALRAHERVGIDTSIFIYHIDGQGPFGVAAGAVLDDLADGAFEGITSVITLMELAVKPLQLGRPEVADEYELLLANYPHLTIADIDRAVVRRAADLRARYRLRPADGLQMAACLQHGATCFLTNDRDLRRVLELAVLLLTDFREA